MTIAYFVIIIVILGTGEMSLDALRQEWGYDFSLHYPGKKADVVTCQ